MLDTAPAPLLDSSLGVSTSGPNTSASVANLSSTLGGGGRTIRPLTQVRYHHPLHSEFLLSFGLDHPKLHREQIQPSSSSESCWQVRFLLIAELRNLVYSYSVSVHRIRTLEIVTTVVYFVVSSCSSLHFILTTLRFQAYKDAQDENKVVPGTNTPTRSNGIVSRAMEYMFGW